MQVWLAQQRFSKAGCGDRCDVFRAVYGYGEIAGHVRHENAPDTLIHGSAQPSESFVETGNATLTVVEKEMHQVRVRYNLGPEVVYAEALEGTPVTITSLGDFVVSGHGGGMVDGYHADVSAAVLARYVHPALTLRSP